MSSIYAFKSADRYSGLNISKYSDLINIYTQLQSHNQTFLNSFQTLLELKDNDQKTAFLQQPNEFLSYEAILYFVFHDYNYFVNKIKPFLQYRSNNALDIWLYYFSESLVNKSFKPDESAKQQVEELINVFIVDRESCNALEIIFTVHMLSFYHDADILVENIYAQLIAPHEYVTMTVQKLAQLIIAQTEAQQREGTTSQSQPRAAQANQHFAIEDSLIIEEDKSFEEILYYGTNTIPVHQLQFRFKFFYQIMRFLITNDEKEITYLSIFEVLVNGTQREQLFALVMCNSKLFDSIYISTTKPENTEIIDQMVNIKAQQLDNIEMYFKCNVDMEKTTILLNKYNTLSFSLKIRNFTEIQQPVTFILKLKGDIYTQTGDQTYKQDLIIGSQAELQKYLQCKCAVYGYNIDIKVQLLHNATTQLYENTFSVEYDKNNILNKNLNRQSVILYLFKADKEQEKTLFKYILDNKLYYLLTGDEAYLSYLIPHILNINQHASLQMEALSYLIIQNQSSASVDLVKNVLSQLINWSLVNDMQQITNKYKGQLLNELIKWLSGDLLTEYEYFNVINVFMQKGELQTAKILLTDQRYENILNKNKKKLYLAAHAIATLEMETFINIFQEIDDKQLLLEKDLSLHKNLLAYYEQYGKKESNDQQAFVQCVARIHENRYLHLEGKHDTIFNIGIKYVNPLLYNVNNSVTSLSFDHQFETTQGEIDLYAIKNLKSSTFEIRVVAEGNQILHTLFTTKQLSVQVLEEEGYIQVSRNNKDEKIYVIVKLDGEFYKDGFADQNGLFDYYNVSYTNPGNGSQFQIIIMDEQRNVSNINVECKAPQAFMTRNQ